MRFLAEIAGLLALVGLPVCVGALLWSRSGRAGAALTGPARRRALDRAVWVARSTVRDGRTVAEVVKAIPTEGRGDDEVVGCVPVAQTDPDDPEWDVKVSQALHQARVRAEILNQEERPLGR